ncbi:MAG: FCD domain-containing protein [Pseudomonadota bacterium]
MNINQRASTRSKTANGKDGRKVKRLNRPGEVSESIKDWIAEQGKVPGDRLPQEPDLIETFAVSKGTIREALKVLETQGLVQTRTGPGGGAFITEMPGGRARALLANHFFFKDLSISDIYELRMSLEPELAVELASRLGEPEIAVLRETMVVYDHPPATIEEEQRQRIAELEFHERLAEFSANPLLGFVCSFLVSLLKDLAVCRKIYSRPNPELRERGLSYQAQLIEAFEAKDANAARSIMKAHMAAAKRLMEAQEAIVTKGFLSLQHGA